MALEARERYSRRALLAGAIGALGSAAAATVAGAQRVLAAGSDGETVVIGGDYPDMRTPTRFRTVDRDDARPAGFEFLDKPAGDYEDNSWTLVAADLIEHSQQSGIWGTLWRITIGRGIRVDGGKLQNEGIVANTPVGPAIAGLTSEGVGVRGVGQIGVRGQGHLSSRDPGRGGVFSGAQAQVRLVPSRHGNHPEVGATGDIFVDAQKRLWFCRTGRSWVRLA